MSLGPKLTVQTCSLVVPLVLYLSLVAFSLRFSLPLRSGADGDGGGPKSLLSVLARVRHRKQEYKEPVIEIKETNGSVPPIQLLTLIFKTVDTDKNNLVSITELSDYIHKKTKDHIDQAMQENYGLFMAIDKNPRNGVISWDEYHHYFLTRHGVDEDYIKVHNERHKGLGRSLKEAIARDKASWSEAAKNDPEFLTLDEFLAFRHPESSHTTLLTLVDDLLDKLDRDGDDLLTEEEFAVLQVGAGREVLVSQGEDHRRKEFNLMIDTDGNGLADRHELLRYIDPKNPRHAKEEAETLVTLADIDHDGQLSLGEILAKVDLFLGSKMVDTAKSFHDEF